jgi:hypothetical protein
MCRRLSSTATTTRSSLTESGAAASAALVDDATLITYEGAPHGITDTHKERLGADLLTFINSLASSRELAGATSGKESA